MKSRFSLLHLIAVACLFGVTSVTTAQDYGKKDDKAPKAKAKVGEKAPAFELKDADGKAYKLSDYKGKIVVLQWINPGCPVCKGVTSNGTVAKMMKQSKELDKNVVFLAINSTKNTDPATSKSYFKRHKIEAPALSDVDGKVGKLYGAKTTPHLYVIDAEGILRYNGAIDDKGSTNYVVNAVRQITAGETVAPDQTKPYGCSVKYAGGGRR